MEFIFDLNLPHSPFEFPISGQNFYSLKTKFLSPMNNVLAKICERSNEHISFRLSQCCKALKQECSRYPIKVTSLFQMNMNIVCCNKYDNGEIGFSGKINVADEKNWNFVTKRKVKVFKSDDENYSIFFSNHKNQSIDKKYSSIFFLL